MESSGWIYSCHIPGCEKKFSRKFDWARHRVAHAAEMRQICNYEGCSQRFIQPDAMLHHIRRHNGERIFQCNEPYCGKPFNSKIEVELHQYEHPTQNHEDFRQIKKKIGVNNSASNRNQLNSVLNNRENIPMPSTNVSSSDSNKRKKKLNSSASTSRINNNETNRIQSENENIQHAQLFRKKIPRRRLFDDALTEITGQVVNSSQRTNTMEKKRENQANNKSDNSLIRRKLPEWLKLADPQQRDEKYDVILQTDDSEIYAHKIVLTTCSPYFEKFFGRLNRNRIRLHNISHMELLINFMYTNELHITEENVRGLLQTANFIELEGARFMCNQFLVNQLTPMNCLDIRLFADSYGTYQLLEQIDCYIAHNFMEMVKGEDFLNLHEEQVAQLIQSDGIVVTSENVVFDCVMNWVKADLENRQSSLAELLMHVRLSHLSTTYLMQRYIDEPLLDANREAKEVVLNAIENKEISHPPRQISLWAKP